MARKAKIKATAHTVLLVILDLLHNSKTSHWMSIFDFFFTNLNKVQHIEGNNCKETHDDTGGWKKSQPKLNILALCFVTVLAITWHSIMNGNIWCFTKRSDWKGENNQCAVVKIVELEHFFYDQTRPCWFMGTFVLKATFEWVGKVQCN